MLVVSDRKKKANNPEEQGRESKTHIPVAQLGTADELNIQLSAGSA